MRMWLSWVGLYLTTLLYLWLSLPKISQILKDTIIPQIKGALIRYNYISKEFEGKCALGILSCESGEPDLKLDIDNTGADFSDILSAYDIEDIQLPLLKSPDMSHAEVQGYGWDWDSDIYMSISGAIIRLNDGYGFTFSQIGEFLEVTFDLWQIR